MTRRFVKKRSILSENGALLNKNFCPKKLQVKILEFKDKKKPNMELI
jgi:hypothetical protein